MRVAFLTYAPRSGSTHLASMISTELPSLLVMPEFRLPEFLMVLGDQGVSRMGTRRLFGLLMSDAQLRTNLGLSAETLRQIADRVSGDGVAAALTEVIKAYAPSFDEGRDQVLLKLGRSLALDAVVERTFPGAKYIHCYRDGRGVVNSLLHTQKVYSRAETMGRDDSLWSARLWRQHMEIARLAPANAEGRVLHVRYERLVSDPAEVLDGVGTFLEQAARPQAARQFSVGTTESSIHPLVGGAGVSSRRDAWRSELGRRDAVVVEWMARRELSKWGYGPCAQLMSATRSDVWRFVGLAGIRHIRVLSRHAATRAWRYRRRLDEVVRHLVVQRQVHRAIVRHKS